MRRMRFILAAVAVMVAMLAVQAGPAMADDCDFRERGDRDDVVVCRDDGDREVFEVEDFEFEDGFFLSSDDFFFDEFEFEDGEFEFEFEDGEGDVDFSFETA